MNQAKSLYTREYFEDLSTPELSYRKFDRLLQTFTIKPPAKILDLGTGRGEFCNLLKKEGFFVVGIDISRDALLMNELRDSDNLYLIQMGIEEIAFKEKTFDIVFMIDILEHLTDAEIEVALSKSLRVLKKGGRVIIHTSPNKLIMLPAFLIARIIMGKKEWKSRKYDINEQSIFSFKGRLRKIGTQKRIFMTKEDRFFSQQLLNRADIPKWVQGLSLCMDKCLDFKPVSYILSRPPLVYLFGTDLWAEIVK